MTDNGVFKANKNDLACVCVRVCLCVSMDHFGPSRAVWVESRGCRAERLSVCVWASSSVQAALFMTKSLAQFSSDGEAEGESPNASKNNRQGPTNAHLHEDTHSADRGG